MEIRKTCVIVALMAFALAGQGCGAFTYLISTPTVALTPNAAAAFEASVPPSERVPQMRVIYASDRAVASTTPDGPRYGNDRAQDLTFGVATVELEPKVDWSEFLRATTSSSRLKPFYLRTASTVEMGRLAIPLTEMVVRDGRFVLTQDSRAELAASRDRLHALIRERLADNPHKDVYLFVHGVNNTFDEAVFRVAQLWHFAGRPGVPVCYTWPAGRGGALGYFHDYDSGNFTVFHLKKFLLAIASSPDVKRVHIVAHSRGADVAVSALRELNIQCRAAGKETCTELKLANLVLAAPDLDQDVFSQRLAIEDLVAAAGRTTVYLSRDDSLLWLSNWVFGGRGRIGTMSSDHVTKERRAVLEQLNSLDFIECRVRTVSTSHDYVFAHPAVVSDLILLLRDNRLPGAANGRPLVPIANGSWRIDNDYLEAKAP